MRPPCEVIVQLVLPALRAELAKMLMNEYGMKRGEVADALGISRSAVSQYLMEKRGISLELGEEVDSLLRKLAEMIVNKKSKDDITRSFCEMCKEIQRQGLICELHHFLSKVEDSCKTCLTP